jgi:hypothetical protein
VVAKAVSKASSAAIVAASVVRSELRRSVPLDVCNEVKYYRGSECSMHVIFPDDAEFASVPVQLFLLIQHGHDSIIYFRIYFFLTKLVSNSCQKTVS